jgi:hypothetical protein
MDQNFPAILIAMQIAALGWRINREIPLSDQGRRIWIPVSDVLNIISMVAVIYFCVIEPLNGAVKGEAYRIVLSLGFILMGMYPINLIGHYRFLSRRGRSKYPKDYPYITDHEWATLSLTAFVVVGYLARQFFFK